MSTPLRIGVSACLMGEPVRYDGSARHQPWVTDTLAPHVELVPVCPEVAIGMGVPRAPIHLVGDPARPHAVGVADRRLDVTARLEAFGRRTARELADVSGFLLKARSPSCGLAVKVHGSRTATASGLFAARLRAALPLLPMADETCLADPACRDNFLERVFAYRRWRALEQRGPGAARLVEFHAAHKLILLSHSTTRYRALGQRIAGAGKVTSRVLADAYGREFMATLELEATPRKHANVLHHLAGYLKRQLDHDDKAELLDAIEQMRIGRAPLLVPLTLLRHHFRRHPHPYVEGQLYLWPEAAERQLRCR